MTTTQTGRDVTACTRCGHTHPTTRPHCTACGLATAFLGPDGACIRCQPLLSAGRRLP